MAFTLSPFLLVGKEAIPMVAKNESDYFLAKGNVMKELTKEEKYTRIQSWLSQDDQLFYDMQAHLF